MENLHLSYTEVFEVIPYRNLLMMQKDKLHVTYGTVIRKGGGAGREMAERRKKAAMERQAAIEARKKQKEQNNQQ